MEIELLSGALGAEIKGVDLKDTSSENIEKIKNLLFEHKVIFFRNQDINQKEQVNLSKCLGPLETHAYVKGLSKFPEIVRIIKDPFEQNAWGEGWHSDVSYNKEPTMFVVLKSVEIPPIGGDTMFSNMELAYETLDKKLKIKIEGKKAIHDSRGSEFFTEDYNSMKSNGNFDLYRNEHPIIRTNPDSGKKALYVNTMYTREIVGLDRKESDSILNELYKHQERLDLTCRFKWTKNAVAIWDNRSVIHYAIADFYPKRGLGHKRVMDRIAIRGEQPF
ncbi:MAG: (R)-phenoxypropionate/alpha-ketoglutarate-dioxygenase [Alphaproteobacteria bacterium MarineAlpha5_Bin9]|nr:MAG: (R)-phenoxypropionate/alpha-ketoglutarate-dioxygenase [Alphaproteobacteria bacterium MarineAlpha5_Bin9]|tara:strand:- start:5192 stop:6019 length:828 start_codon:yes stop_codon:yes gene_type:complete